MAKDYSQVKASYGRCLNSGDLIAHFYEIFLKSHPAIAPKFANTNFAEQKNLLNNGVNLAIMYAEGNSIGQNGLTRIRDSHKKTKMNIEPSLYGYWLESFIKAVADMDKRFSPEIEQQWREVLQYTVSFVAGGYEA